MISKKKAFVLGMAKSGYEAAKFLISKDFEVVINDAKASQILIISENCKT